MSEPAQAPLRTLGSIRGRGGALDDDDSSTSGSGALRQFKRPRPTSLSGTARSRRLSPFSPCPIGLTRRRRDLEDGTWERRYGDLLGRREIDLGYRLLVSSGGRRRADRMAPVCLIVDALPLETGSATEG